MTEPKTECTKCGRQILQATADRNGGVCAPCFHDQTTRRDHREYEIVPPDPVQLDVEIEVATLGHSNSVVWKNVEDALFLIASRYVQAFGALHRDKTFYGFAFDCNADYGQVFVCANTPSALIDHAKKYKARSPDLYGQFTVEEIEDKIRWSVGDWEFQAFTTDGFSDAWEPIKQFLAGAIPWDDDKKIEEFRESFMATACRSMVRLESQSILSTLSRTHDFKTFVADHDEPDQDSWARLAAC